MGYNPFSPSIGESAGVSARECGYFFHSGQPYSPPRRTRDERGGKKKYKKKIKKNKKNKKK
jgi:hypothetical protein